MRRTSATGYAYPSTIVKTVTENGTTKTETTAYTYDMLLGLAESITDDDGNVTRFEYDKLGRPTRIIYPKYSVYTSYGNKNNELFPVENISYTTVLKDNYGNTLTSDEDLLCQRIINELTYYITTDTTPVYPTDEELSGHSYTYKDAKINLYMGTGELIESKVIDTINGTAAYVTTSYVYDSDANAQVDAETGGIYYYLYNRHGDVVQIVDTNGNIKNSYDYDVWGNFLKKEETIENSITYFGQTFDEETGLYYLRARYYDPTTGRFTQQDPATVEFYTTR